MTNYRKYRRTGLAEMTSFVEGMDLSGVSISLEDADAGSPKVGDMIARNPMNNADKWLVAAAYFKANFEEVKTLGLVDG